MSHEDRCVERNVRIPIPFSRTFGSEVAGPSICTVHAAFTVTAHGQTLTASTTLTVALWPRPPGYSSADHCGPMPPVSGALVATPWPEGGLPILEVKAPSASAVSPQRRMFFAAFTSRSWTVPQSSQVHSLIPRPAIPLGLEWGRHPHFEQVWVVRSSDTSRSMPPLRNRNFHASMSLKRGSRRRAHSSPSWFEPVSTDLHLRRR